MSLYYVQVVVAKAKDKHRTCLKHDTKSRQMFRFVSFCHYNVYEYPFSHWYANFNENEDLAEIALRWLIVSSLKYRSDAISDLY